MSRFELVEVPFGYHELTRSGAWPSHGRPEDPSWLAVRAIVALRHSEYRQPVGFAGAFEPLDSPAGTSLEVTHEESRTVEHITEVEVIRELVQAERLFTRIGLDTASVVKGVGVPGLSAEVSAELENVFTHRSRVKASSTRTTSRKVTRKYSIGPETSTQYWLAAPYRRTVCETYLAAIDCLEVGYRFHRRYKRPKLRRRHAHLRWYEQPNARFFSDPIPLGTVIWWQLKSGWRVVDEAQLQTEEIDPLEIEIKPLGEPIRYPLQFQGVKSLRSAAEKAFPHRWKELVRTKAAESADTGPLSAP